MKKIKIVGIQTHFKRKVIRSSGEEKFFVGAVDYARIIQPLKYLPKDEFDAKVILEPEDLDKLTKENDIIYTSYIDTDVLYVKLKVMANKNNCEWIFDLDDNIWNVHKSHPYYNEYNNDSPKLKIRSLILKDTNYLTTTNKYLKKKMIEYLDKKDENIEILPNYVDLSQYDKSKVIRKRKDEFQITYIGGSSHFDDINKPEFIDAMKEIMKKYPNVIFKTTFFMPTLKAHFGNRYRYALGFYNVYSFIDKLWPQMVSETDVFVAPLSHTPYSKSKSYIKYLEYSAGGIPAVCENISPYSDVLSDHPERGLLAFSKRDWIKHLSYLIDNPDKRKEMGENAYNYVKENHTIEQGGKKYADYFKKVLKNREK